MSAFVVTGVIVSLSTVVFPPAVTLTEEPIVYTTPMYEAVLSSLLMPASCLTFGMLAKYALVENETEKQTTLPVNRKLTPNDYTFAYFFVMFSFSMSCAIFHFMNNPGAF